MVPEFARFLPWKNDGWETDGTDRFEQRQRDRDGQLTPWVRDKKEIWWDLLHSPKVPPGAPPAIVVLRMKDRDIVADGLAGTVRFRFRWRSKVSHIVLKLAWLEKPKLDAGLPGEARFEVRTYLPDHAERGVNDGVSVVMTVAAEYMPVANVMHRYLISLWGRWAEPSVRPFADEDRTAPLQHSVLAVGPTAEPQPPAPYRPAPQLPPPTTTPRPNQLASPFLRVAVRLAPADADWIGFALLPDTEQLLDPAAKPPPQPQPTVGYGHLQPRGDFADHWHQPYG